MPRTQRFAPAFTATPTVNGQAVILDDDERLSADRTRKMTFGEEAPSSPSIGDLWLKPPPSAMIPSIVTVSGIIAASVGTDLNIPISGSDGQLALVPISSRFAGSIPPTVTGPPGSYQLSLGWISRDYLHATLFFVPLDGTESFLTFSTAESAGQVWAGYSVLIDGAATSTDPVGGAQMNNTSSQSTLIPDPITTLYPHSLAIYFCTTNDDNESTMTTANGFTELAGGAAYSTTEANDIGFVSAYQSVESPGQITPPEFTQQVNGSDPWAWIGIEIRGEGQGA